MSFEFTPPKYVRLLETLRERMDSGEYPVGSLLPGEHQLRQEFNVSRATVVKALEILRQEGWIEPQQGRGTFVRGRPVLAGIEHVEHGRRILDRDETTTTGRIVTAGPVAAPARIADLLALPDGSAAFLRQRVITYNGTPSELVSAWFPLELAEGTDLHNREPLTGSLRAHLEARKGLRVDHLTETVSARHAIRSEAKLLDVTTRTPVLVLVITARDAGKQVLHVVDVVVPGSMHELEDIYRLS